MTPMPPAMNSTIEMLAETIVTATTMQWMRSTMIVSVSAMKMRTRTMTKTRMRTTKATTRRTRSTEEVSAIHSQLPQAFQQLHLSEGPSHRAVADVTAVQALSSLML